MKYPGSYKVTRDLAEVATILLGMRTRLLGRVASSDFEDDDALVLAAVEKAGMLTDRAICALGTDPVLGGIEEWANQKRW